MKQFETFETASGIVVVNKATITYIQSLPDGTSMIFFNATGSGNKAQAVIVNSCIEELKKILNDE